MAPRRSARPASGDGSGSPSGSSSVEWLTSLPPSPEPPSSPGYRPSSSSATPSSGLGDAAEASPWGSGPEEEEEEEEEEGQASSGDSSSGSDREGGPIRWAQFAPWKTLKHQRHGGCGCWAEQGGREHGEGTGLMPEQ